MLYSQRINLGNYTGPFHGNIRPELIGNANFRMPPPSLPFNRTHQSSNFGRFGYEPIIEVKSGERRQHHPPPQYNQQNAQAPGENVAQRASHSRWDMPPPMPRVPNMGPLPSVPTGFNFNIPPPTTNAINVPLNMQYLGQGLNNQFPGPNNASVNQGVNFFNSNTLPKVNQPQAEILALRTQIDILTQSLDQMKSKNAQSKIRVDRVGTVASCSSASYGGLLQETEGDSDEESDSSGN